MGDSDPDAFSTTLDTLRLIAYPFPFPDGGFYDADGFVYQFGPGADPFEGEIAGPVELVRIELDASETPILQLSRGEEDSVEIVGGTFDSLRGRLSLVSLETTGGRQRLKFFRIAGFPKSVPTMTPIGIIITVGAIVILAAFFVWKAKKK